MVAVELCNPNSQGWCHGALKTCTTANTESTAVVWLQEGVSAREWGW